MKKIILLVITAISLIGCNLNKENNDWKRDNLKGKVKSVRETPYYVVEKFGEIQKGRIKSFITSYIYNEQGNLIEANRYNSDGNLYGKWTYKYDTNGNRIEANSYNSDGSLSGKTAFKYDTNGNRIEANRYNSDGSLYATDIYTYEYDKYGNWVKRIMYNNDKPESIDEREIEYYE
ncbi:conserved exported hypothetical protein [Capnocytophaga canimorsus]|uniref:Uncharacterized protein n=1 Tax=Capnocytophaga canimorsus TaxID=28188 RepID=A0A0B7IQ65_9FLAO|nr:hypothetical protein [Capnocytophaga canimorsus]CEN52128.1 conserved exported hypothetical protein [Capnocytophaga canimorsus]